MILTDHLVATLLAALSNRGLRVAAWYQRDRAIGLLLACGQTVEVERDAVRHRALEVADLLAAHLPRSSTPRDYDPLQVPEISPLTARWWEFLRWGLHERRVAR